MGAIRRLALLSDVHANLVALDAVLADLATLAPVDEVWALGDLVAIGPDPVGVLERLHELPSCRFLAGNSERYVRTGERPLPDPATAAARPHLPGLIAGFSWTAGRLHEAGWFDWLTSLPATLRAELATGERIVGVHATPDRDDGSGIHGRLSDAEIEELLDLADADVLCGGHTHLPLHRRIGRGDVVNLGSVSNPSRHGVGCTASYVVIDATGAAADISHRSVAYDVEEVLRQLHALRHPAVGFIEDSYFGRHVQMGR
ncbi:metallophosphoesterase family protein [Actinomarinicola tropica]|uniref:metallophosphoesterase family protein n=1 Tax=Actinomarinicola tropica TaxID=2789776 RepID=UPI00189A8BC4|nr:metallophosphoesterase family protein [Actinomarinicola tropica]